MRAAVKAVAVYYRAERLGNDLPSGPVLVVTNHPNMLMDPLVAMWAADRRVRVLAKAPLFDIPLFGRILRSVDTLPLFRVQDDPDQLPRNRLAFREAADTLAAGGTLLTFPEGKSHTSPRLAPLKSGAARIALAAEEEAGWKLGVRVVPIGLAYERKQRFRSEVVATLGDPIVVSDWRVEYDSDQASAIRSLTVAIARGLEQTTLNFASSSDRELAETADLVSTRAQGLVGWRIRERFSARLPRIRLLAEQLGWLRACDRGRYERLTRRLRSYGRRLARLGGGGVDVPAEYDAGREAGSLLGHAAVLSLILPLAVLGAAAWCVPFVLGWLLRRLMRPPVETVATVEYLAGFVAVPLAYAAWIALSVWEFGLPTAVLIALLLPPLGLLGLHWWRHATELLVDLRVYVRTVGRPRLRRRLQMRRSVLVREIDDIAADWRMSVAELERARRPVA